MKLRTTIIILHHTGVAHSLECLRSLYEAITKDCMVILVQNGFADPLDNSLLKNFSNLHAIQISENIGFTGGVNTGIRCAFGTETEYIWLVNNDTILSHNTLSSLTEAADGHPEYAALSPVIYQYPSMDVWFGGSTYDPKHMYAYHQRSLPEPMARDVLDIPWSTGCAMFLRRSALEEREPFDDRYFLKWEDVDLSLRLKSQGWGVGLAWKSAIYHKVSQSCPEDSPLSTYYHTRNHLLLALKHAPRSSARIRIDIATYHLRTALSRHRHGAPLNRSLLPCMWGVEDHLLGHYGRGRAKQ